MLPGSGPVASAMGLTNHPLGTPEELRAAQLSPRVVPSCAPPPGTLGVDGERVTSGFKGCSEYHNCIFRFSVNGGFRDLGPKTVGYYHRNHDGYASEHQCSCYHFMSQLHHRMEAGQRDRNKYPNAEIIEVIGVEGGANGLDDHIHEEEVVDVNAGKAGPNGNPLASNWVRRTVKKPIRHFLRPLERQQLSTSAVIEQRRMEREARRGQMAQGPPLEERHRVAPLLQPVPDDDDEVIDIDTVNAAASAAPPEAISQAVPVPRKAKM